MKTTWFSIAIGVALGLIGGGGAVLGGAVLQQLAPSVPVYAYVGGALGVLVAVGLVLYGRRRWPAVLNFDADIAELFGARRTPRVPSRVPAEVMRMIGSAIVVAIVVVLATQGAVAGALIAGVGVLVRLAASLVAGLAMSGSRDIPGR